MENKLLSYIKVTMYEDEIIVIIDEEFSNDAREAINREAKSMLYADTYDTIYDVVESALDKRGISYEILAYDDVIDISY